MPPNLAALLRLMLVTDDVLLEGHDLSEVARAAVNGGVTSLQLRLKRSSPRELVLMARRLIGTLDVPVLVNDRLDVALAAGAAGVHLGQDDVPVSLARAMAPPGFLIGASVGTLQEISAGQGADYWGVGPLRASQTKLEAGSAIGVEGFRSIVEGSAGIPCIAIGGVLPDDVPRILAVGGAGVAVVSGILARPDVQQASRQYAESYRRLRSTINGK
jgi:thiamine-phosphate pyrophosphorylase